MNDHSNPNLPTFYITAPSPCPYLPGRVERKMFTHLTGSKAGNLNDALTHAGFRRSQTIAYRPACDDCNACVSIRIQVDNFEAGKSFRRIVKKNTDLTCHICPPLSNRKQYDLLRRYLDTRHEDGGMSEMRSFEYMAMVEETPVDTHLVEYHEGEELLACVLMDKLSDGLSMVYSFFNPLLTHRSLGTYMILDQIERTRAAGLPYLYLGYWVDGCQKMNYKARFQPLEQLTDGGWKRFIGNLHAMSDK